MRRTLSIVAVSILASFIWNGILPAATPGAGTLTAPSGSGTSSVTWTGGPYTAVTADPSLCTPSTCDNFNLTVNIPASYYTANPASSVRVRITWASTPNDFDLYVYDSGGNLVNSSAQGNTTFEDADLGQLTTGTYLVKVVAFSTVNESYSGTGSAGPPPADKVRGARYRSGGFTFTAPKALLGPDGLVFGVQDLEPRAAFDPLGNIYVAAIQGVPAGTDVWKSMDGGNSFSYLGQPDGAQAASALAGRTPGVGGGDEDIAVGPTGRVTVSSLWLGSMTACVSTNGGALWAANPVSSDVPGDDRQWIATHGDNEVYQTFQQIGVLLAGTSSIFVLKSLDGGLTYPQIVEATTPELGVQPEVQGTIAVDQKNGYVYNVFIGHPGNGVYLLRSTDGGLHFTLGLVHQGPAGTSYANVFPIVAVDRGGNVHIVYSDGTNVYLTSSATRGATWTTPVRVNNGTGTKTALAPWVDAGNAGKVDIIWWGTSSSNNLASDAHWKVFFAQTLNAFASTPTITETAATGVFHTGPICVNGLGCPSGTRALAEYASTTVYRDGLAMIVYPDDQQTSNPLTYFVKQTAGSRVFSTPLTKAPVLLSARGTFAATPERFELYQNYPNPFNPSTLIRYDLPGDNYVQLSVYNILGQKVADLVKRDQSQGAHSVIFDAARLPGGVYFYKLAAGPYLAVRRMSILR